MQSGMRTGTAMALMKAVVEKLNSEDMVALSAYVGSLEP
jgi:cytochrome c553